MPGRINGNVTRKNVAAFPRAQVLRRLLDRSIEVPQPGPHDRGDEDHVEHDVRGDDRVQPE